MGIYDSELAWMHGDTYIIIPYVITDFGKFFSEIGKPINLADRMRGERNQIRSNPKEQDVVRHIIPEYLQQRNKIIPSGIKEAFLGVGLQTESSISFAPDGTVNAGISYFHYRVEIENS